MSGFHRLQTLRMENDQKGFDMDEMRGRFMAIAERATNGTAPRAVVARQLFQSTPAVASLVVEKLAAGPGARFLEPSAGLGRLLDALRPLDPSEVVAVEVAPACAAELYRHERAGVTIKQRDFLACSPAELGTFDFVVMNPPFTMRSDIRHIEHARQFLRPGGRLSAVCMDTQHRRHAFSADGWTRHSLPRNSFASEGTRVETAIVVYQA